MINGSGTSSNLVEGNYIGTDKTGMTAFDENGRPLGNTYEGVYVRAGASENTVGGTIARAAQHHLGQPGRGC